MQLFLKVQTAMSNTNRLYRYDWQCWLSICDCHQDIWSVNLDMHDKNCCAIYKLFNMCISICLYLHKVCNHALIMYSLSALCIPSLATYSNHVFLSSIIPLTWVFIMSQNDLLCNLTKLTHFQTGIDWHFLIKIQQKMLLSFLYWGYEPSKSYDAYVNKFSHLMEG